VASGVLAGLQMEVSIQLRNATVKARTVVIGTQDFNPERWNIDRAHLRPIALRYS